MGLFGDRTVGHGARAEALDDRGGALDLVEGQRAWRSAPVQQTSASVKRSLVWSSTSGVYSLKMSKRFSRVACWSFCTVRGLKRCSSPSRRHWYSPRLRELHAFDRRRGGRRWRAREGRRSAMCSSVIPPTRDLKAREVPREDVVGDPDRLEELGTDVARDRAHAHLRHDLHHALVEGLAVLVAGLEGAQRRSVRPRRSARRSTRRPGTGRPPRHQSRGGARRDGPRGRRPPR